MLYLSLPILPRIITFIRCQFRVKSFCLYFCIFSIKKIEKNSHHHYNYRHGNGGECHNPLEKETKEEAAQCWAHYSKR